MLIFNEIRENILPASCLALGMFDGVHLGHQKVILDAVNKSKQLNAISTVVTFSNHPQIVISGKSPKLLTTLKQRLAVFEELGVQAVFLVEFTPQIAKLSANQYLKQILINTLNPKTITVGYNHHFGVNKEGDTNKLIELSKKYNFEASVISPICIDNHIVSSSLIRSMITNGDAINASKLMGRPYSIKSKVIYGEQRGRKMGFPTANMVLPDYYISPKSGIYSGYVNYQNKIYKAVINVGKRPTFNDLIADLIEVHIIDFNCDIYGDEIEVFFYDYLRAEKKFDSVEKLVAQIKQDYEIAKNTQIIIKK